MPKQEDGNKVIYYTTWDKLEDTRELYAERTGHDPQLKGTQAGAHLIIAREEKTNKIVGVTQLIVINDPTWDRCWGLVENVYVRKDYRRQGIGVGLMKFLEQEAYQFGCSFIKLTSGKEGGKALYRSLGYEEGSSFRKNRKDFHV